MRSEAKAGFHDFTALLLLRRPMCDIVQAHGPFYGLKAIPKQRVPMLLSCSSMQSWFMTELYEMCSFRLDQTKEAKVLWQLSGREESPVSSCGKVTGLQLSCEKACLTRTRA